MKHLICIWGASEATDSGISKKQPEGTDCICVCVCVCVCVCTRVCACRRGAARESVCRVPRRTVTPPALCVCACRVERSQQTCPPHRLHLEECLPADQVPTPELIQGYVKKVRPAPPDTSPSSCDLTSGC